MQTGIRTLLLLLALLGNGAAARAPEEYAALAGRKALAEVPGRGAALFGIAHSQPTDTAAATMALANCRALRPSEAQPCELIRLNDETITSGAAMRARAGTGVHPLYLWHYRSETATVFLMGSIHVLKPSLYPLAPQVEEAFAHADYLVLEVDTQRLTPAELQAQSMRVALLPDGQTLGDVLPGPLHARLDDHLQAYGLSTGAVARAKPAVVMNEVVLARLTALGYTAEHGLERHFRSRAGSRPVLELESISAQLALLFDQPMPMQIALLADALEQEYRIEPLLTGLLVAWLAGDDARLLALFEQQAGDSDLAKAFNRQLLDDRNVGMAEKVRGYLQGRGTHFVLAGAAHFIGPAGIVSLLERQGISGHRYMSDEPLNLEAPPVRQQALAR